MKVLIVDYSIRIAERLEELLSEEASVTEIHKAVNYLDAMDLYGKIRPGIVLLDMCLPSDYSFKILKEIKTGDGNTCVIILADEKDSYVYEQCNSLGADFLLDKYSQFHKIPGTVNLIINTAF